MRLTITFLLLGVLCRYGHCDTSTTAATTPPPTAATTPPPTAATPPPPTTSRSTTATMSTSAAVTTTTFSAQSTSPAASADFSSTSAKVVTPVETPTTTVTMTTAVRTPEKTATVQTKTPTETGPTTVTMSLKTATPTTSATESFTTEATKQTQVTQPQASNPQSTTLPATPTSANAAVTSTGPTVLTETTATAKVAQQSQTSPVTTTHASMSSVSTSQSPTETSQSPQNQSLSSTGTTVNLSRSVTVSGMEGTTSKPTTDPPRTTDVKEIVVFRKGQQDDKGNSFFFKVCEDLMNRIQVNSCTLDIHSADGTRKCASLAVSPALLKDLLEKHKQVDVVQAPAEEEPPKNTSLIVILCSCGALLVMTAAFIAYITCHRKNYRKNQQHLTEELQTVENGYHDNPTLEVMEVQPEMQEKKAAPNGEFNDSWIVPFDTLGKEEGPEEEDTHL